MSEEDDKLLIGKLRIQVNLLQEFVIYLDGELGKLGKYKTPKLPEIVYEKL